MSTLVKRNGIPIHGVDMSPSMVVYAIFVGGLRKNFDIEMAKSDVFNPKSWSAIDPDTGDEWTLELKE